MRNMTETIADGTVQRRYFVDGAEVDEATFDAATVVTVESLAEEVRGIRDRADQAAANAQNGDAKAVGQAVAGPRS